MQIEHIEELPVMDYKNKSITADRVTSFDVNKTIQRSLTKAVARHGLGLYIYAGEDLPEAEQKPVERPDVSRQTLLDQIFALDVTRKELDAFIQSKKPDKDADTVDIEDLKSIKTAIVQKRRNA